MTKTGRAPHFIIAGTQKGGTTWLEHNLARHPSVFTPHRQLHFFDRHFDRGADWYHTCFANAAEGQRVGEKTTEYFDTLNCRRTAERMASTLPEVRLILMLRNPVDRAFSALEHMVNSGLEPLPRDPEALLWEDAERPEGTGFRYLERGLYASQLAVFREFFPAERILCVILEDDVISQPEATWDGICRFLEVKPAPMEGLDRPVNRVRLSRPAARLSWVARPIPFARGAIRRIDRLLPLPKWRPHFSLEMRERLEAYYGGDVARLERMLGRQIHSWFPSRREEAAQG